jgi:homoserine O-acetyltransferase/O-succinyltransferase
LFIIVIMPDAVGHGGSSKPSDGLETAFPRYCYGDIVGTQHLLVTEGLGFFVSPFWRDAPANVGPLHCWRCGRAYVSASLASGTWDGEST